MPERQPLELTVYPQPRYALTTWQYQTDPSKRLTDTDLAAEFWRVTFLYENSLAQNDGYDGATETVAYRRQWMTLHRFAAHDHYDQGDQ